MKRRSLLGLFFVAMATLSPTDSSANEKTASFTVSVKVVKKKVIKISSAQAEGGAVEIMYQVTSPNDPSPLVVTENAVINGQKTEITTIVF